MNLPKLCVAKDFLCFKIVISSSLEWFLSVSIPVCCLLFLILKMTFGGLSVLLSTCHLVSFVYSNMERKNSNYLSIIHMRPLCSGCWASFMPCLSFHSLRSFLLHSIDLNHTSLLQYSWPLKAQGKFYLHVHTIPLSWPNLNLLYPFIWGND